MSLTTLGEVPRSVSRFSRVAVAIISDWLFFQWYSQKKWTVDQNVGSVWSTLYSSKKIEKWASPKFSQDNPEARNWSGYLSESSQTHSDKSRLDFLSLQGKNYLETKKISVCNLKKNVPHKKRPNPLWKTIRKHLSNFRLKIRKKRSAKKVADELPTTGYIRSW